MKYMLDTNACIHAMRGEPPGVRRRLRECGRGEAGLSSITYCELEYGIALGDRPDKNRRELLEFLVPLVVTDFRIQVAPIYGLLRADLRRAGRTIGPLDTLIAAHALSLNCTLVTHNVGEFSRVPGLRVENWVDTK